MTFPVPFTGITESAQFADRDALANFVSYVALGCGENHDHNIAVAFDGNSVHGTPLLMECVRRWSDSWEDDL